MLELKKSAKAGWIPMEKFEKLEKGTNLLSYIKTGDDYLQATVWDMIFDINPIAVIESLTNRDKRLGKTLLHDVLEDLNIGYHYKNLKGLSSEFTEKLKLSFDLLNKDIQCDLSEEYNEFI